MPNFTKFVSTYGDGESVTYFRALDPKDQEREDELNAEHREAIDAYNDACTRGQAGKVVTETEAVDR